MSNEEMHAFRSQHRLVADALGAWAAGQLLMLHGPSGSGKSFVLGRLASQRAACVVDVDGVHSRDGLIDVLNRVVARQLSMSGPGPGTERDIFRTVRDARLSVAIDSPEALDADAVALLERMVDEGIPVAVASRNPLGLQNEVLLPVPALGPDEVMEWFEATSLPRDPGKVVSSQWGARSEVASAEEREALLLSTVLGCQRECGALTPLHVLLLRAGLAADEMNLDADAEPASVRMPLDVRRLRPFNPPAARRGPGLRQLAPLRVPVSPPRTSSLPDAFSRSVFRRLWGRLPTAHRTLALRVASSHDAVPEADAGGAASDLVQLGLLVRVGGSGAELAMSRTFRGLVWGAVAPMERRRAATVHAMARLPDAAYPEASSVPLGVLESISQRFGDLGTGARERVLRAFARRRVADTSAPRQLRAARLGLLAAQRSGCPHRTLASWLDAGFAAMRAGQPGTVEAAMRACGALLVRVAEPGVSAARTSLLRAYLLRDLRDVDSAADAWRAACANFQEMDDAVGVAEAALGLARTLLRAGRTVEAEAALRLCSAQAELSPRIGAEAAGIRGLIAVMGIDMPVAVACFAEASSLAERSGDPWLRRSFAIAYVIHLAIAGRIAEARETWSSRVAPASAGDVVDAAMTSVADAVVKVVEGEIEGAERAVLDVVPYLRSVPALSDYRLMAASALMIADVTFGAPHEVVQRDVDDVLTLSRDEGHIFTMCFALCVEACLHLGRSDLPAAARSFQRAVGVLPDRGAMQVQIIRSAIHHGVVLCTLPGARVEAVQGPLRFAVDFLSATPALAPLVRVVAIAAGLAPARSRGQRQGARPVLWVDEGGAWFKVDNGPVVDINRRANLRRLLVCLAERSSGGDASVAASELIAAAWPDARLQPSSASNRLYVAISTLRKLGLDGVLRTDREGWRMASDVRVVEASSPIDPLSLRGPCWRRPSAES